MDYGNEEELPYNQLRPLDPKFCDLPCQAVNCSLKNVRPFSQLPDVWCNHVCAWFSSLLLGKSIQVSVSEYKSPNPVALEIFLPQKELKESVLANFVFCDNILKGDSIIPLSSFMDCVGLSSLHPRLENGGVLHYTDLPPLIIRLNASQEFTCLMSHVSGEMLFYVHPVQEDLAHNMNFINDQLYSHHSTEQHCVQMPCEDIKCGNICSSYSVELQQWCRGIITSIKTEVSGEKLECLVFFLDYGVSEWRDSSKLFNLINSLRRYPSQVVCCNFKEVTRKGECKAGTTHVLSNPKVAGCVSGAYECLISQIHISECVHFMRKATEEKQLFVVVNEKGDLFLFRLIAHLIRIILFL